MSRREAALTAVGIFVLALAVRAVAAAAVPFAVPEDTAYYWGVGRNLVEGRGLVSDAIWSYNLPPYTFPHPAFEIWMPLPTLLAAPFLAILGTGFRSAQVAGVLVSAIVPVLTWRLVADLAVERELPPLRARILAVGAGVVAAVYGPLVLYGALPDSTAPFTAAAVAACILMERVARDPRGARLLDPRLLGVGIALGLAALARNEAVWYAAAWVLVAAIAARGLGRPLAATTRLVAGPAAVAIVIYLPWAARQWATFGTPLPGQAIANAFSRTGNDIFAWADRPSFASWLAQGPAKLVADRVDGFLHNLVTVLLVPAIPVGPVGLVGLPCILRSVVLRPLLLGAAATFVATTLLFPVSTTWGTFLHAAGPVQVLLVASATAGVDALVARIGRRRAWRPSAAIIAPVALAAVCIPMLFLTIGAIGAASAGTRDEYADLQRRTEAAGIRLGADGPVIADFPIWLAESARIPTLALPQETPAQVLDLARSFGARYLVLSVDPVHGRWPAILDEGGADAACFVPVPDATVREADGRERLRVYRIGCP